MLSFLLGGVGEAGHHPHTQIASPGRKVAVRENKSPFVPLTPIREQTRLSSALGCAREWRDRQQRALTAPVPCSVLAFIGLRTVSKLMPIIPYTHLPKHAPFSRTFGAAWAEQSGFSQCQSPLSSAVFSLCVSRGWWREGWTCSVP